MTVRHLSYSLKDAVQATGIGRNTLLAEIHAGKLKAIRVGERGGKWVIPRQSLDAWFERQLDSEA